MKKILFILSFISCSAFLTHAQHTGWESGVLVSGGIFGGGMSGFGTYKYNITWHYGAGVYARKFWRDKFGIELGLQYSQYTLQSRKEGVYWGNQITGLGYIGNPSTVISQEHFRYLELPIRFVFKKDWNKFGLGCFAGVLPAVMLQSNTHTKTFGYEPTAFESRDDISTQQRRLNVMADIGLLLRANISEHFSLDTRPFFRTSVLTPSPSSKGRVSTVGISLTSVWKF